MTYICNACGNESDLPHGCRCGGENIPSDPLPETELFDDEDFYDWDAGENPDEWEDDDGTDWGEEPQFPPQNFSADEAAK